MNFFVSWNSYPRFTYYIPLFMGQLITLILLTFKSSPNSCKHRPSKSIFREDSFLVLSSSLLLLCHNPAGEDVLCFCYSVFPSWVLFCVFLKATLGTNIYFILKHFQGIGSSFIPTSASSFVFTDYKYQSELLTTSAHLFSSSIGSEVIFFHPR